MIAGFLAAASTAAASTPTGNSGTAALTAAMIRDRRHAALHRWPRHGAHPVSGAEGLVNCCRRRAAPGRAWAAVALPCR